jgi:tryptophan halogenase
MKIVIVGGGSAGWMSALTLQLLEGVDIHVVQSPSIPTISVGESTIMEFVQWMIVVGLDPHTVVKETNGSFKLAIKFIDFCRMGSSFFFPFGKNKSTENRYHFELWNYMRLLQVSDLPLFTDTFYPNMALIKEHNFTTNEGDFAFNNYALHFDASLFAKYLQSICIEKGVHLHSATVEKVLTNDDGVEAIHLDSGEVLMADLYIDCTGFKSLLLGDALKEPFIDYSDIIPNNKAFATQINYKNKESELESFTSCTALSNGWVWNIPLWSRIGCGYVYSNRFISNEDALCEFKDHLKSKGHSTESLEFRNIDIRNGTHKRLWVKNVVAIGLSAGFVEPLESTGLWFVHTYILLLLKVLKRSNRPSQIEKDIFNKIAFQMFDNLASFVSIHYGLSQRLDSDYWVDISKRSFLKQNNMINNIFYDVANKNSEVNFGLQCILTGFDHFTFNEFNSSIYNEDFVKNYKNDKVYKVLLENITRFKNDAKKAPKLLSVLESIHLSDA